MTTKNTNVNDTSSREIVITRLLNAPRELVFEAWTNPEHLIKWWGPRGFTNTFENLDIRPGGEWSWTMHGMGRDFPNKIVFHEVVKPEKLVYTHGDESDDNNFHVTVTFEKQGEKTFLKMLSVFGSAEKRDLVVKEYGAIEGGNQTVDKLEEQLEIMKTGNK